MFALIYIYSLRLYLSNQGGVELVGFFGAGMLIVNNYVGLVFNSMGTEYYPRLAAVTSHEQFIEGINTQIKRSITLLAPLVTCMMVAMPLVVRILYTEEFLPIIAMSTIILGSVSFKIVEWCIGFAFIAKGQTIALFLNEVSFKIYTFVFSIYLYNELGLVGIGLAYLVSEVIFCIQSLIIARNKWNVKLSNECMATYLPLMGIVITCLFFNQTIESRIAIPVCILCILYCTYRLFTYIKKIKS